MKPMPAHLQRRHSHIWLGLLGIIMLLLVGCSSSTSSAQTPSATAGTTATTGTTPAPTATAPTSPTTTATNAPTTTTTNAPADWSSLESKPLHLPTLSAGANCPVTQAQQHIAPDHQYAAGNGPVYLVNEAIADPLIFLDAGSSDPGSSWKISKVFWEISSSYTGPAIVRGGQINGTNTLKFNGGLGQTAGNNQGTEPILHELRLQGDPHGQWRTYLSFVRVQQAGCYAIQIDGQNFSESIVINATVR